ncbi:hypothetical protein B0H14DRAFT_3475921 [Mycena olivaceomarginata]|nr:hypothetical protein B0H14DRAFT_3475921 [Mycena olivaceomarginata]
MAAEIPSTPPPKLEGYEFYREVLGSPKYIVAPMVDQSVSGSFPDATALNSSQTQPKNTAPNSSTFPPAKKGNPSTDRPLIVQFCANDPEYLLTSAKVVEGHRDGVDINLGTDCFGRAVNTLHKNLAVPVTAKFRIFPNIEKTGQYAQMLERAGTQILTCHGRQRRGQRGQNTVRCAPVSSVFFSSLLRLSFPPQFPLRFSSHLASYPHIRAVNAAVCVPVFANGNVLFQEDIGRCLRETGCDGVMSAEGVLYKPALFAGLGGSSSRIPPSEWGHIRLEDTMHMCIFSACPANPFKSALTR